MKRFICWTAVALALFAMPVFGAVPRIISYQGVVTDNSGTLISAGSHSFQFNVYNHPTIGTPGTLGANTLWFENQSLPVALGGFSTQFPSPATVGTNPLALPFDVQYYLGISVDGGAEMSPRTPLTSSPYSLATRGITVDASENVGLGTTAPNVKLEVAGLGRFTGAGGLSIGSDVSRLRLDGAGAGSQAFRFLDQTNGYTGLRARQMSVGGNFGDVDAPSNGMIVQGRVGIGTSTPGTTYALTVTGDGAAFPAAGTEYRAGGNAGVFLGYSTPTDLANFDFWNATGSGALRFGTSNAERMRISSLGKVGIGTANPMSRLHVSSGDPSLTPPIGGTGTLLVEGFLSIISTEAGPRGITFVTPSNDQYAEIFITGTSHPFGPGAMCFSAGGGVPMIITASRDVGIGTTSPSQKLHVAGNICATGTIGACSDERFKTHIAPLRGALDVVRALRPVRFDWRTAEFPDRQFSDKPQVGFIAQQVLKSLPEVVAKGSDGYYSVDYGRLTPVLVQAMQELREQKDAEVAALKSDNAELRRRLEKLEAVMLGTRTAEAVK